MPALLPRLIEPACVMMAGDESVKDIGDEGDEIGEHWVKRSSVVGGAAGAKTEIIYNRKCHKPNAETFGESKRKRRNFFNLFIYNLLFFF